MDLRTRAIVAIKEALVRSRWRRRVLPRYVYNFDAAQLCFLCDCLERTREVKGAIAEVGVAGGETTLFLNSYLDARKIDKPYLAIDTFAGFTAQDIAVEVKGRSKRETDYRGVDGFEVNRQEWYDATMRMNGVTRVRSIRADVNEFDLGAPGAIAFCLLDVDLYRPTKKALGELYVTLSPGGMIVVDDCSPDDARWDGALQAYREFAGEIGQAEEIVFGKLGVVRKET